MGIPNEAGKFALSWSKLTPENKSLVVLLGVLGLFGTILYNDRNSVVEILKTQITSYERKEERWNKSDKSKDSTIVLLSTMMINLARQTTKYNDSMRIEERKRLEK